MMRQHLKNEFVNIPKRISSRLITLHSEIYMKRIRIEGEGFHLS